MKVATRGSFRVTFGRRFFQKVVWQWKEGKRKRERDRGAREDGEREMNDESSVKVGTWQKCEWRMGMREREETGLSATRAKRSLIQAMRTRERKVRLAFAERFGAALAFTSSTMCGSVLSKF